MLAAMRWAVALACMVLGCTDLAPLSHDVCGNGVVEHGEDCDGEPSCDSMCRYSCSAASCPAGWVCGRDAICRHGTGQLVIDSSLALPHDALELGDVDGDGADDIVALDARGT